MADKLTINGQVYTKATDEQIKAFSEKVFIPSDGMKEGDTVTFATDLAAYNTSGTFNGATQTWNVFPCEITRGSEKIKGVISTATLLNSGYNHDQPNPEKGTEKNVPFNTFSADAIVGKTKEEVIPILIKLLAGKTFTIRRATFHQPTQWVNKKKLNDAEEWVVDYKENGKPKKVPYTEIINDKRIIPTSPKTISQLIA